MSLLKDWAEDHEGMGIRYKIKGFINPSVWFRLHKWRNQRADRGWSDRDTWGAGEHIAKMTAEMLQHLNDKSYCNWPDWFKNNTTGKYDGLQQMIDDINNYLEYQKTSWSDGLDNNNHGWYAINTGEKLTEKQVTVLINKYYSQDKILHEKAIKAMTYFGRNFTSFWD